MYHLEGSQKNRPVGGTRHGPGFPDIAGRRGPTDWTTTAAHLSGFCALLFTKLGAPLLLGSLAPNPKIARPLYKYVMPFRAVDDLRASQ
ncbi:hypothetical protein HYQ46_008094 [Verticillium longisporum]|nr:hypothetical protein HYQ46_008094 [Verticillium longisporum]